MIWDTWNLNIPMYVYMHGFLGSGWAFKYKLNLLNNVELVILIIWKIIIFAMKCFKVDWQLHWQPVLLKGL